LLAWSFSPVFMWYNLLLRMLEHLFTVSNIYCFNWQGHANVRRAVLNIVYLYLLLDCEKCYSFSLTLNAWHKLGAMPTEEAMQGYITIVQDLFPNWDAGASAKRKDEDSIASASASKGPMGPVFSSLMYEEDEGNESELGDIHVSAREGATDDIVKLLAAGVEVNVRDTEGRSPLHWAVDRGHLSAVEVLANANADLNAK
ncbi:hypothetical protein ACJX0J_010837, partial [Zea mays]